MFSVRFVMPRSRAEAPQRETEAGGTFKNRLRTISRRDWRRRSLGAAYLSFFVTSATGSAGSIAGP